MKEAAQPLDEVPPSENHPHASLHLPRNKGSRTWLGGYLHVAFLGFFGRPPRGTRLTHRHRRRRHRRSRRARRMEDATSGQHRPAWANTKRRRHGHPPAPTQPPSPPPKAFRATAGGPRGSQAAGAEQARRCAGDAERRGGDAGLRAASTATPFAVPGGRGKDVLPTCSLSPWCPEGKSRRLLHPSDAAQPVGCRPRPVEEPPPPPLTGAPQRSKLPARASPESLPSPSEWRRKG